MARFYRRPRRFTPRPRRHLDITAPISASAAAPLIAEGRPPEVDSGKRRPWAWIAAAALHAAIIALLLLTWTPPPQASSSPPAFSVVFNNGGAQQTANEAAQFRGTPAPATSPPPAAPALPQTADAEPEVNLNLPEVINAPIPQSDVPETPALPAPQHLKRLIHHRQPTPKYTVMNGMSFNGAPAVPGAQPGLNLNSAQSFQTGAAPEFTIRGNIGPDWNAEIEKWGSDHSYYPDAALAQNQQGNVTVEFLIDHKGKITGLHIVQSSGSVFLDQAWLGLFNQFPFPPVPPEDPNKTELLDYTIHYVLDQ